LRTGVEAGPHLMGAVVVDRAAPNDSICGSRTIRYVEAERFDTWTAAGETTMEVP